MAQPMLPIPEATEWSPDPKFGLRPNDPAFHGNGRYGAPANPVGPAAPAAPAASPQPVRSGGWFKRTAQAATELPGKAASGLRAAATPSGLGYGVGRAAAVVGKVAPVAAGADVVSHFNDYKINDPEVDSSASGTFNALRKGDWAGAGRSASKGALEAGMDLGSVAANAADLFVPGNAPVSTAYNGMLRRNFGSQLVDQTAPPASPAPATTPAIPGAPNPTDQRLASGTQAPVTPPTVLPAGALPAAQTPNEVLRNGNEFSGKNVREGFTYVNPDGSKLGANPPVGSGMGIGVDGYMRQLVNLRSLPEPERGGAGGFAGGTIGDSLRTSPIDPNWMAKHQMANSGSPLDRRQAMLLASQEGIANKSNSQAMALAQLREGGENSRAGMRESGEMTRAKMGQSTTLRGQDIQQGLGQEGHAITREGNQLTYAGHMAPLQLAAQLRAQSAAAYQAAGAGGADGKGRISPDQHRQVGDYLRSVGNTQGANDAYAAATTGQALDNTQEAQSKAGAAGAAEVFKPMFTRKVTDAQGNVKEEFDEVGAARAAATMRSLHGAGFDKLTDEQKRSAYTDVTTQQKNMDAERQVMPGFVDRMKDAVGMYQPPPAATAARDLRGGTMTNAGLLSPPGVDRRSTLVKLPNGETINYGVADDAQIAAIKKRTLR